MLKNLLVSMMLIGGTATGALAQPSPWTVLGTRDAGGADERVIDVGGRTVGVFRDIALEASKGVPMVRRVTIKFDNHTRQVVELGSRKIDRSNPRILIPLDGGERAVEAIIIDLDRDSYGEVVVSGE